MNIYRAAMNKYVAPAVLTAWDREGGCIYDHNGLRDNNVCLDDIIYLYIIYLYILYLYIL